MAVHVAGLRLSIPQKAPREIKHPDGYVRFAWLPRKVGAEWVWLVPYRERYHLTLYGECVRVRTLRKQGGSRVVSNTAI